MQMKYLRDILEFVIYIAAVILITEDTAARIPEAISRYRADPVPAIIPIPGASGSNGLGMANVRANVEKAVGADILFKEDH